MAERCDTSAREDTAGVLGLAIAESGMRVAAFGFARLVSRESGSNGRAVVGLARRPVEPWVQSGRGRLSEE